MSALQNSRDTLFAVLMSVASLAMVVQAYGYDDDSSHFPRFLALVLLGLSLLYGLRLWCARRAALAKDGVRPAYVGLGTLLFTPWMLLSAKVVLLVAVYALSISLLGYYSATLLFLPISMILLGRLEPVHGPGSGQRRALGIALGSAIFLVLVWSLFSVFLGTRMPQGILF